MKGNILVIEDDESIQLVVRNYLESSGYQVTCAFDGADGLHRAMTMQPDLIVLDVNLPGMRGFEVAEQLQQMTDAHIIMLTARGEERDRIRGLQSGADDYVVKPFSPRELVARVNAAMRRRRGTIGEQHLFEYPGLTIDAVAHEVRVASGETVEFTKTEFQLLMVLARHEGQVMSRQQLLNRVWGVNYAGNDRVVDVYISQVRRKLEDVTGKPFVTTVRGVGYKFKGG